MSVICNVLICYWLCYAIVMLSFGHFFGVHPVKTGRPRTWTQPLNSFWDAKARTVSGPVKTFIRCWNWTLQVKWKRKRERWRNDKKWSFSKYLMICYMYVCMFVSHLSFSINFKVDKNKSDLQVVCLARMCRSCFKEMSLKLSSRTRMPRSNNLPIEAIDVGNLSQRGNRWHVG